MGTMASAVGTRANYTEASLRLIDPVLLPVQRGLAKVAFLRLGSASIRTCQWSFDVPYRLFHWKPQLAVKPTMRQRE